MARVQPARSSRNRSHADQENDGDVGANAHCKVQIGGSNAARKGKRGGLAEIENLDVENKPNGGTKRNRSQLPVDTVDENSAHALNGPSTRTRSAQNKLLSAASNSAPATEKEAVKATRKSSRISKTKSENQPLQTVQPAPRGRPPKGKAQAQIQAKFAADDELGDAFAPASAAPSAEKPKAALVSDEAKTDAKPKKEKTDSQQIVAPKVNVSAFCEAEINRKVVVCPSERRQASILVSNAIALVPAPFCDVRDQRDPNCFVGYLTTILLNSREREAEFMPNPNYLTKMQAELTGELRAGEMRSLVVDWLVEVHSKMKMQQETLYLAINMLDRYLSTTSVQPKTLQLIAVACLLIASKYEDTWPPEVKDLVWICQNAFTREDVLNAEVQVLNKLKFVMTFHSPLFWLIRFGRIIGLTERLQCFAQYLIELLMPQPSYLPYTPSMIAAAALHLTLRTFKKDMKDMGVVCPEVKYVATAVDRVESDVRAVKRRKVNEKESSKALPAVESPTLDPHTLPVQNADTLKPELWPPFLAELTGYSKDNILEIENLMSQLLRLVSRSEDSSSQWRAMKAVKKKFSGPTFHNWGDVVFG